MRCSSARAAGPCLLLLAGLAGCGSSGSSDISNIASAAMKQSDLPAGLSVKSPGIYKVFSQYAAGQGIDLGEIGGCGGNPTAQETENFVSGLSQTALNSANYGILECAVALKTDAAASAVYSRTAARIRAIKQLRPVSVAQVGDATLAATAGINGVVAREIGWRHANALISLVFANKQPTMSMDQLHTLAAAIDGRLK